MKHIIRSTTGVLIAGAIAAGCATPSQSDTAAANTAIGNAGHAIEQAASNPHVAQYASSELGRAQDSLRKAQKTWKDDHDLAATTNLAYLAQQRALTAQELANERASEDALKVAAAERDHALSVAAAEMRAKPGAQTAATATTGQAQLAVAGFASGKAALPASMMATIDELAAMLKNNPGRKVVIEGHTDSVGSAEYNNNLAMERANAVRAALAQRGIDPSRVTTRSLGEENPIASNDTSAGRGENRRADVMIAEPAEMVGRSGQSGQTGSGQNGQDKQ
jgi:outer membrane protein OmpA-like peptidoglycan-associated protein